jgi:hypothetical protein
MSLLGIAMVIAGVILNFRCSKKDEW